MKKKYIVACLMCAVLVGGSSLYPINCIANADYCNNAGNMHDYNQADAELYEYFNLYSIFDGWFMYSNGPVNNADKYGLNYVDTLDKIVLPDVKENCYPHLVESQVGRDNDDGVLTSVYSYATIFEDGYDCWYDLTYITGSSWDSLNHNNDFLYYQIMSTDRYILNPDIYNLLIDETFMYLLNAHYLSVSSLEFVAQFKKLTSDNEFSMMQYRNTIVYDWDSNSMDELGTYSLSYFMPSIDTLRLDGCVIGDDEFIYLDSVYFRQNIDGSAQSCNMTYYYSFYLYQDGSNIPLVDWDDWESLQLDGRMYTTYDVTTYYTDAKNVVWNNVEAFMNIELFDNFYIYHLVIISVGSILLGIILKFLW